MKSGRASPTEPFFTNWRNTVNRLKLLAALVVFAALGCAACFAEPPAPTFKKLRLTDKFYAEGSYYGDFNKDGKLDEVETHSVKPIVFCNKCKAKANDPSYLCNPRTLKA